MSWLAAPSKKDDESVHSSGTGKPFWPASSDNHAPGPLLDAKFQGSEGCSQHFAYVCTYVCMYVGM